MRTNYVTNAETRKSRRLGGEHLLIKEDIFLQTNIVSKQDN